MLDGGIISLQAIVRSAAAIGSGMMNAESQLQIESLDQVTGGCGHRRSHQAQKQTGNIERAVQPTQQVQPIADLAIVMAGARIRF